MAKHLLFRGLMLQLLLLAGIFTASAQSVFINEIHYDNDGTDSGEAVEIAGPAGTDLTGWSLVLYNGNGGGSYSTQTLSGTLADAGSGYGVQVITYPSNGIQNGSPDGLALVDAANNVVQFLSYEGTLTATDGPANGLTSVDIGQEESSTNPLNYSLQLTGTGTTYTDFSWASAAPQTFGAINTGQSFGGSGGGTDPDPEPEEPEEPTPGTATSVFINEIHYDNDGTDANEAIEIAGPAGTDLSGWSLVSYNGNNGAVYDTQTLSGTLSNQTGTGFGFVLVSYPVNGIQNGAPDGVALVDAAGGVVQFLSYEGTFTAIGGPADGLMSTDIGVAEGSSTAPGLSLQLSGTGSTYEDFTWVADVPSTYNAANEGQVFVGEAIVFINEIHYDNDGSDVGEGVEIAGTAGTDLTGWQLLAYNGNGGAVYDNLSLSGVLPALQGGFGALFFPISGLQNGAPDGIALVSPEGEVVQFLSYEGSFTAVGGAADGLSSIDIGVAEGSSTPVGSSLQLTGSGFRYEDFTWSEPMASTYNALNTGQSFGDGSTDPEPVEPQAVTIAEARTLPPGTEVIVTGTLTVSDQLGGPAFIEDETGGIALFDPQVHGNGTFAIGDRLQVTASVGAFNQQVQLVDVTSVEDLGPASDPITPTLVTIAELGEYEGQLVSIENVSFTDARGLLFPDSNYEITDGTGTTDVRIDADVESLVGRYIPQEPITLTGVVGSFRGSLQLFPRFIEDLPGTSPYEPAGTDIPLSTTLEVMSWNMEFFGSTLSGFGPSDVQLQLQNAKEVIERSNADVIAVQEISDEALLQQLADMLGYEKVCSDRYSYSFEGPDPTFPAQQLCFLYNPAVITLLDERVIFEELYDAARAGESTPLDSYPDNSPSSFWSSGRLPYMITVDATIEGVTERIQLINIHAKSGSSGDDLTRRRYDVQALSDTLTAYYPDANLILLGDYNDDVDESIGGGTTTYSLFVEAEDFRVVTATLSEAGLRSFISRDNVIDHITISDELYDNYLTGTATLLIPFSYIDEYGRTTSDHLPVLSRFELSEPLMVSITGDQLVYVGYGPEECTTLTASATGGSGTYTYRWSTGEMGSILEACPDQSTTYTLTVEDGRGNTVTASYSVCAIAVACQNDKVQLCWQPNPKKDKWVQLCLPEHLVRFFMDRGASLGDCFAADACETFANAKAATARQASSREISRELISIDSEMSVTPSLAHTRTHVQFVVLEEGRTTLKLYSLSGQEMTTLYDGNDLFGTVRTATVPLAGYTAGMYLVKMTTASGAVFTAKFMISR